MCSDHVRICRLARVNSHTLLIVFVAPKRLCDYEKLLHQNVHQHAVFPIAHVPEIISQWHACHRLPTPGVEGEEQGGRKNLRGAPVLMVWL